MKKLLEILQEIDANSVEFRALRAALRMDKRDHSNRTAEYVKKNPNVQQTLGGNFDKFMSLVDQFKFDHALELIQYLSKNPYARKPAQNPAASQFSPAGTKMFSVQKKGEIK